ncbi:MAG: hypothetical protein LBC84_02045 [Prevotellaceae bacterium]|jgi:hypothetical protein|nr:hypothetical protein [Prevotellaceae bacterium]
MSDVREDFIPLRFPVSPSRSADIPKSGEMNGIMIELPTGIKIHVIDHESHQAKKEYLWVVRSVMERMAS